jgi:hypothetical protein
MISNIRSKLSLGILVTGFALTAQQASAQDEEGGWFATVQYGRADYDVTIDRGSWWGRIDDTGHEVAVGIGYDLLPQLAARVMYQRIWGIDAMNVCPPGQICPAVAFRESTRADQWSAAVVPKWRFQEDWEVFATLGALRWELEPSARIGSDRDTDFLYGAGIAHRFDSGLSASFEVQRSSTEYSSLRLGVTYRW